ncbi:MAG: hypothetical protein AAB390_03020 [Patescibacteria group bacterium]
MKPEPPPSERTEIKGPTSKFIEILSKNKNFLRLKSTEVPGLGEANVKLEADIGFMNKDDMEAAKELLSLIGAKVEEGQLDSETDKGEQVLHSEGNNVLHVEITMQPHIKDLLTKAGVEFTEEKTISTKVRDLGVYTGENENPKIT